MSFRECKLSLNELTLWDENARFPDNFFNSDEKVMIEYFVANKTFKMKELVEDIAKDLDLPMLEKMVIWGNEGSHIVLEGNRRLAGYKILANPAIIADFDNGLYKYLIDHGFGNDIDESFSLDCLVSDDKQECYRYIDRKHSKGNNQVNWLEPERINYSKRRGIESNNSRIKGGITKFVRNLDLPEEVKNQVLGKGYVTTFYRFVTTGPAKETFGLSTDENGNLTYTDPDFPEKLKVIIHNVLRKVDFEGNTIDSRELNKNPQIKNYLEQVNPENVSLVKKEIEASRTNNLFGENGMSIWPETKESPSAKTQRKTPKSKENNVLFGKSLALEAGKVNDLYRAVSQIYEQNQYDPTVLPVIGMSMRLLTEVAARVYYDKINHESAKKDQLYKDFLKTAKNEMNLKQDSINYLALTRDWLDGGNNLEAILGKYAHGNITVSKDGVLKSSFIIGAILEHYFGR